MSYIESGKEQGANVHLGGGRVGNQGYFVEVRLTFLALCVVFRPIRSYDPFLANNFHGNQAGYENRSGRDLRARRCYHQVGG